MASRRIADRLPSFYRTWDRKAVIARLIEAFGSKLDESSEELFQVLKSHWVDTATGEDLDKLGALLNIARRPGETDRDFRVRLKTGVQGYMGGGTKKAILSAIKVALGLKNVAGIEIVENPLVSKKKVFRVRAGERWRMSSEGIDDVEPKIRIAVESKNARITNPEIKNLDTGESISFQGVMITGQVLEISSRGALLDGKDVTQRLLGRVPVIPRRETTWVYTEALEERIGVFNKSSFNQSVFALEVPLVRVEFEWRANQRAAFEVRVSRKYLKKKGVDLDYLRKVVESVKAVGVQSIVKIV